MAPAISNDLIVFAVALMASFGLTIPVRHLALRYGMVDHPNSRKVHLNPIPLLGGIAIYLAFALAILLTRRAESEQQIASILAGATLVALVGFLDDGGLLHHQVKLFVGMPVAAIFLLVSGIRAQFFSAFVPGTAGIALDGALTVLWVIGITASFSILDHMDGLCAGIAGMAALFFTISAAINGQKLVGNLGAATLGASVGFLLWNFNPAKIFMGDGGAMFLGFLMAALGLKIRPIGTSFPETWLVPILILAIPIFDTTLVTISRARRGLLPFTSPGKDHTAHRLSNLGLGQRGAVMAMYVFAAAFGIFALFTLILSPIATYALAGTLLGCALIAVHFLEAAPYERQVKLHKASIAP